jgi:predicted dehydrogenase
VVQDRWRESPGPGSGIWYDLGSHLVDQALLLFGEPDAVTVDLEMQRKGAAAVDYFHVVLRYGRMRAVLHGSNLVAGTVRRFEVHGTGGTFVKLGMDSQEDALKSGGPPASQSGFLTREGTSLEVPMIAGDYAGYYEAIRDAIENGGPNPVPAAEALAVVRILESAQRRGTRGLFAP